MKFLCSLLFTSAIALTTAIAGTPDYRIDTTFNAGFQFWDQVNDILVLPDGKLLVGGRLCTSSSNCTLLFKRLNSDGTVDGTFNSALGQAPSGLSEVTGIKALPNGQILVTGNFTAGPTHASFAKLNANGSLDSTLTPSNIVARNVVPTPDGKYIVCWERVINGQLHDIAYRLNADGTPDPSFRITFIQGTCEEVVALPNGKIMLVVSYYTGNNEPPIKPLFRLNSDGSQDSSFDAAIDVGARGIGLTMLPDGKMIIRTRPAEQNTPTVRWLLPDGGAHVTSPYCNASVFVPAPSDTVITSGCKRHTSTSSNYPIEFARLFPDGGIDSKLDNVYFDQRLEGLRDAGNGKYYAFGGFAAVNKNYSTPYKKLVRLEPHSTPPRAKYDFDGDGKSDYVVYRPSDGYWYLNQSTAGLAYFQWGTSGDRPAAAHFDADGKTDFGVIRAGSLQAWSSVYGHRFFNVQVQSGAVPFPGNYNDAETDIDDLLVRGLNPAGEIRKYVVDGSATWIWWQGVNATYGASAAELLSYQGLGADLNGDSRTDLGYFHDGVWRTGDVDGQQPVAIVQWGAAGDIPVPDDYDGDRQADYAVFRPSTGDWWINRSTEGLFVLRFGANGDIPVPADYDGDGKVDIAIYRNGQWWQYLIGSGTVQVMNWGTAGDIPIPAQSLQ